MSNETTTSNDSASFSIRHVVEPLSLEKCVCTHTRGNHSSGERHCLNHFCECGLFRVAEIISSPARPQLEENPLIEQFDQALSRVAMYGNADQVRDLWQRLRYELKR